MYPKTCGKGQWQPDGSYRYTCNACNGSGKVGNSICSWCYALDAAKISTEMKAGARGQRYYALLKAFLSVNGKAIVDETKRIKRESGKLTPVDLGYVSLKFGLNFKATVEWLEETQTIRQGNYHRMKHFKISAIYDEARKRYNLNQQTEEN